MKGFDFLDILADSLTSLPLRILAVWIACGVGTNIGFIMTGNFEIWFALFFPIILLAGSFSAGWWMFLAIPILVALAVFIWHYLVLDCDAADLIWMLGLSSLIMIPEAFDRNIGLGILYLICVAWTCIIAFKSSHDHPSPIDHV